ncbi:MAG: hypothetical protein ACO1RX_20530 [Candidatus Sericytochromatia bacterium]
MPGTRLSPLLLLGLLSLSACTPPGTSQPLPGPSPDASAAPTPVPGVSATPTPVPSPTASPVVPTPSASAPPAVGLPAELAGIRFAASNVRFLNQKGQSTPFEVEALDREGRVLDLNLAALPLEWRSSRPQDFSVDAQGQVTALVESGYSSIEVRVPGSDFQASSVVNIATGSGNGGGGGGSSAPTPNAAPVISALNASSETVNGAGTLVQLSAVATDADDTLNENSYTWRCAPTGCGTFSNPTGSTVYWRAPATGGTYVVTLSVSDGQVSTTQDVNLVVNTGEGNLTINPPD